MKAFLKAIQEAGVKQVYTDELRCFAWGTDASFYRLTPKAVVFPADEEQMQAVLSASDRFGIPLTFRAAGTSLSGQSVSDSVLVVANKHWERFRVLNNGAEIALQPGVVGARVNAILKPYGRKFAPDPASVKSAMVGGIVSNNASGMNCGTHANSDAEILSARLILADGTMLDTGDAVSREAFKKTHRSLVEGVAALAAEVKADTVLAARIQRKYAIKNVTGLNLLPLIRFADPFDIITHLIVGSEGTLAFLAEVTMKTRVAEPLSASAMIYFPRIDEACRAVQKLKPLKVDAAELLDRKALRSVEDLPGMPSYLKTFGPNTAALLVQTLAMDAASLQRQTDEILAVLTGFETLRPAAFTSDPAACAVLWNIRSGIFPSVGGLRELGTTSLIEDVAFHLEDLPEATAELQRIIDRNGYHDGVIYGHALEGNYHFILNQRFDSEAELHRYQTLMNDVIRLVVDRYDGSLKAEHGTGRNMAPFVRREWGDAAYAAMQRVKALFDPKGLLNPGVIFNDDPECHLKHLKPLPRANAHIDRCIECGFCEVNCLSCGLTLSSRQRIAVRRQIARLRETGEDPALLAALEKGYRYYGETTCAGDGLCATSCPMSINTGDLTHDIRAEGTPCGGLVYRIGAVAAGHLAPLEGGLRGVLRLARLGHLVLGTSFMSALTRGLHRLGLPLWVPAMPKAVKLHPMKRAAKKTNDLKVVYFPSCINQTMGAAADAGDPDPLADKMTRLLEKAGYEVIFPEDMGRLCCGTIWESKGMPDLADRKSAELEAALWKASEGGRWPVVCDQSPCLYRMKNTIKRMKLYDSAEFIETFLVDRLTFHPQPDTVAIHVTCSVTKMGLRAALLRLAGRCAAHVFVPEGVGCCGFAGDKGFTRPEVNAYALRKLRGEIAKSGATIGYSTSRTCEIGLTTHGGIPYMSIVYLVDSRTTAKNS